jgi:hypothetical protein
VSTVGPGGIERITIAKFLKTAGSEKVATEGLKLQMTPKEAITLYRLLPDAIRLFKDEKARYQLRYNAIRTARLLKEGAQRQNKWATSGDYSGKGGGKWGRYSNR